MANVVLGVTGGIAAYKCAPLIRLFTEAGHSVQVVVTKNALRFIGQTTLEALSGKSVQIVDPDLFSDVDQVKHIALAKNADLVVIAPATAAFVAKVAAGIADDLLTTTVLAASCPIVLAPAMHTEMWENQSTQANIQILQQRGVHIVEPGIGRLTGQDSGQGRLAEPEVIFSTAISLTSSGPLEGYRVLVAAGGTREPVDAVRFIGNYSSGKQGIAFARQAQLLGASVHLVAANVDASELQGLECEEVSTTEQLRTSLLRDLSQFDLVVMAAAVSDYRPEQYLSSKIKRSEVGEKFSLELVANPDILKEITERIRQEGSRTLTIGFAAEASDDLERLGKIKLVTKNCDFIVANDISGGAIFGSDDTSVVLVSSEITKAFSGSKASVAKDILLELSTKLRSL